MQQDYGEILRGKGSICSISVLCQDGPLSREVYQVTLTLLKLAEDCWSPASMKVLSEKFPRGTFAGSRTAAVVGSGFHDRLYDLAAAAQRLGRLPHELVITLPVTRKNDPTDTRRTANIRKGPDFVLRGNRADGQTDAAWDFTTSRGLASHYDRDILGKSKKDKPRPDIGVQQVEDNSRYWSSYIAICY